MKTKTEKIDQEINNAERATKNARLVLRLEKQNIKRPQNEKRMQIRSDLESKFKTMPKMNKKIIEMEKKIDSLEAEIDILKKTLKIRKVVDLEDLLVAKEQELTELVMTCELLTELRDKKCPHARTEPRNAGTASTDYSWDECLDCGKQLNIVSGE